MSLIVQVGGGGGGAPPPPQKGVVITATSHVAPAGAPRQPQPPPAHVTQPFSSPSYVEPPQHVVQHHPQPQPQVIAAGLAQRPLSHSPSRQQRHRHGEAISGNRIVMNHHHHHHLPTQPLPHLPSSPLPILSPSPAGQLLHTSVNSPSLIPQNIPSGLMPRLPLQLAGRHQLSQRSVGQDNNILPPHAFRKLNRQTPQQPDDDIEMTENHQHPPRRSLMSPKHNRRNFFNNLALQDHNYCAAPPPSPPRSPTPPRSPYTNNISHGMVAAKHEQVVEDRMTSYIGPASPHYRLKQSIDEAGVGPLTPGDNESFRDRSASDNMEDGGEETETAPEADDEGQDDSVTRCICDFQHDDGYMIQCDKCSVWQHVVCMGLDKNNIPDEYLCEKCNPRPVDRKRAKALQKAREKEIFAKIRLVHDSSDDDKTKTLANLEKNRKHFSSFSRKFNGGKKDLGKKLFENKKLLKKTHKKRLLKDNARGQESSPTSPSKKSSTSPRKNNRRKSLSATDAETEPEENPGETLSLRSWIDNYEEAVTNHYSPELRARLSGAKISTNFSKAKDVNGIRCNVSLRGNGLKVLTANSFIPSDTPVIECRGKYMLNNPGLNKASKNNPYVLQHKLNSELEVLVDGTTYGNDSRFCRRASPSSGESNAVIRHHLEKGSLHLYIVASRNIEKNQEILLPSLEKKNGIIEEEMSIADELREIKKASGKLMNGNVEGRKKVLNKKRVAKRDVSKKKEEASSSEEEDDERKTEREARIAKEKERLARQREEREKEREREDKASPRKTRSAAVSDVKEEVVETVKEEVKEEVQKVIKKEEPEDTKQLTIMIPKEKGESMENSPSASDQSPVPGSVKSPSKPSLGLPDQSGLIVGVNTINYDVSFRNKTKTREERKMEMIMKAIEAMEKNEARKRNDSDEKGKPEKKRRRSNSTKTGVSGAGESQDQSSADEGYGGGKRQSGLSRGRGRKPGASLSGVRRRSRAKSGDSSAMSETETADDIVGDNNFKYPGAVCEDQDDDVSRQYIRGSRSPPGIANHLLRSAKTDRAKEVPKKPVEKPVEVQELRTQLSEPKTIGCSAKKRWLRAAMSVDMSESERPFDEGGSGASPAQASPEPDYTPLKKRRLATYSNDASEDVAAGVEGLHSPQVSERIKSLPNGIKKKLMSNLVLEAVLDKAMEDFKMPPGYNDDNALDSNNEDTSSPLINDEEMDESESSGKPRSFKDKRKEAIYKAELDRKSANSSESEEATVDAGDVQYKEAPVPGLVNNDPAHDNNVKVPENENKSEDDVPLEEKEFCMTPVQDEPLENGADEGKTDPAAVVPSQNSQFKSFFSTDLSVEDIDRQLAAKREALVKEAAEEAETMLSNNTSPGSEESRPGSAGAEPGSSNTPQVKKVVSLADYKKRKQQVGDSSVSSTPASTPTTPTPGLAASLPPLSLTSLPSLPGLDSFSRRRDSEILSEKVRSRNNSSHRTSSRPNSASNSRSPSRAPGGHKTPSSSPLPAYQEQPREDLTERLRKEFGLNIDESDDADTDGGDVVEREEKVVKEPRERKSVGVREDSRLDSRREGRDHRQSEQSRVHRRESHSHSDKNYKYDKRDYRDSRDSYKSHHRDSRYHDKRPPSHHSASRRPPHPSSPTNGPARGLHNGGSRRSGSRHNSPTRRNSQESESRYNSHSSHSYYKNESSRRNLSRNFYTQ